MDLLSVLLHEYGHALGLDHSTAATDAMAATLKVGERRLWTEAELAQVTSRYNQLLNEQTGSTQVASTAPTKGQSPHTPFDPSLPSSSVLLALEM